ncbi:MAG: hypothetical protein K2J78_12335, partial [Muribaculaceae bacterium]|nr:hypothetical protein [Muribaculaceae bacterium]
MLNRLTHSIALFILSTVLLATIGCGRHSEAWNRMDLADSLMETMPDSALAVLNDITLADLHGREEAARYALLKSMALDKNYVDTTTFDILQPAIDYYPKHGTPDEKLRTFYYQGRIFQNQGDDASAMRLFIAANDLKDVATDTLLLAHNLVAMGTLDMKQYMVEKFIQDNLDAAKLYGSMNKGVYEVKSYANAALGHIMLNNKVEADSLMSICMELMQKNPDGEPFLFTSYVSYIIKFGTLEEVRSFLGEYEDMELSQDNTMDLAYGYAKIGEYEKALGLLSGLNLQGTISDSLKYAAVRTQILEKYGKYEEALKQYRDYSVLFERYQSRLMSDDLLFAEERHKLEMEKLIEIQDRNRVIGITLCCLFGLLLVVGWLYYRYRLTRSKRLIAEKENENLLLEQERIMLERD